MNEMQRQVADEVIRGGRLADRVQEELSGLAAPEVGGVEKPRGFFNELGAPREAESVEKPGGLFNTTGSKSGPPPVGLGADAGPGDPLRRANRGGRPTIFTPELKERFEMLLTVGMSRRQAAAYLGIDHTTVAKLAARNKEFGLSLKMAEDQATVNPLLTIISESRKNWRAAAWLLKYRGSWPVDPVQKTEEEKEEEHQQQLRDDARWAERNKLRSIAMHESLNAHLSGAGSLTSLSARRQGRA